MYMLTHTHAYVTLNKQMGEQASQALATLAETGNPSELIEAFENANGVSEAFNAGGPTAR